MFIYCAKRRPTNTILLIRRLVRENVYLRQILCFIGSVRLSYQGQTLSGVCDLAFPNLLKLTSYACRVISIYSGNIP